MDFILVDRFGGGGTAPSHYSCIDAPTLVVRGPAYCRMVSGIAAAVQESRAWLQLVWVQIQIALIASCGAAAPQTSHVNLGGSRPRPPASLGGYRTPKHRTGDLVGGSPPTVIGRVWWAEPPRLRPGDFGGGSPRDATGAVFNCNHMRFSITCTSRTLAHPCTELRFNCARATQRRRRNSSSEAFR